MLIHTQALPYLAVYITTDAFLSEVHKRCTHGMTQKGWQWDGQKWGSHGRPSRHYGAGPP